MTNRDLSLGKKVFFSLVVVLISLVISEFLVRIFLPGDFFLMDVGRTYRPDPVLHRTHVSYSKGHEWAKFQEDGYNVRYSYDQHGMRRSNDFLDSIKPVHECRILLIGDSFIEQRQLKDDQLIQAQLEQLLNAPVKIDTKVFAFGVSGWGTVNYDLYYKTQARGFGADLIFVFLSFNDYQDDELFHEPNAVYSPTGELLASPAPTDYYLRVADRDRPSFSVILDLIRYARKKYSLIKEGADILRPGPKTKPREADSLTLFDPTRIGANRERVKKSLSYIQDLFTKAKNDGSVASLVLIPFPHQLSPSEWAIGRTWTGIPKDYQEHSTAYQDLTHEVAREIGIETIDLLPVLMQATAHGKVFNPYDGHFTAYGANKVAEVLKEAVLRLNNRCGSR
jgi:lysophospholipase L1-like esterase